MTTPHAASATSLRLCGMAFAGALLFAAPALPAQDAPAAADERPAAASEGESIEEAIAADAAAAVDDAIEVPAAVGLDEVRRFVAVFRAVQQAYVDPVVEDRLMQAAVRGLLTDLDPHSSYLEQDAASALNEQASGAYDGLGLEVLQQPDRTLLVVAPIDDTPAARAGIRPGDVIVAVDGVPISADTVEAAVESMRGAPGTPIELTLVREGEEQPLVLTLVRETIRVTSVRVELLEPGYAYARVAMFQADSGTELKRKLAALGAPAGSPPNAAARDAGKAASAAKTAPRGPLRGLVLDLRSNPGGLLSAAVEIADLFLEQGVVVSTRGRLPAANAIFRAAPGDVLDGAPIVILTDAGTASAAEVVAGALRDQRRAVVMGGVSFGKGSVQTLLPLDNGDAIKITTARYYTPNGTSIQAAGIVPDIALDPGVVLASRDRPPTLREADLRGHLENEADDGTAPALAPVLADTQPEEDDYAVREALNLLKGVAVFSRARASVDEDADDE